MAGHHSPILPASREVVAGHHRPIPPAKHHRPILPASREVVAGHHRPILPASREVVAGHHRPILPMSREVVADHHRHILSVPLEVVAGHHRPILPVPLEVVVGHPPGVTGGRVRPSPASQYCPAQDPAICLNLVEELMHLIIILITVRIGIPVHTDAGIYFLSFSIISQNNLAHRSLPSSSQEMPPPSPRNKNDHAFEAKRRLKREVIHRLASGNKTHSEMAEVHHVLPLRDNFVLYETGK